MSIEPPPRPRAQAGEWPVIARWLPHRWQRWTFGGFAILLLLLAILLLPFAHVLYARWVRRRFPSTGSWFVHDGVRLHYTSYGLGPVVALVHGANGTWSDFSAELIAELATDRTVLALDRPGHGWSGSQAGPLGLHENAAAVLALLRHEHATGATLVAHIEELSRSMLFWRQLSHWLGGMGIIVLAVAAFHMLFSSNTVTASIITPILVALAKDLHLDPWTIVAPAARAPKIS